MKTCTAPGCDRKHKSKGYCDSHYARFKRGLPLDVPLGTKSSREGTCSGPECSDPIYATGLCTGHYWQRANGYDPLVPKRQYAERDGACQAETCERDRVSEGLCQTHYRRRLRGEADWDRPILDKAPAGTGHLNPDGYRIVQCPRTGRPKGLHVVMAERLLDRPLLRERTESGRWRAVETVHHKDGNRDHNVTDGPFVLDDRGRLLSGNLEVWSTSQPAGQEIGPKIAWAVSLLETYAEHLSVSQRASLAEIASRGTVSA